MKQLREDRFIGAMVAHALGDAFGAPYEGGLLERGLWALIGKSSGKRRWTDDTQMTLDVAESLLANGRVDQDDLAHRFAASYRWSRGYGEGTARLLRRIRRGVPWQEASRKIHPGGSYGNGGAMRSPVVGLYYSEAGAQVLAEAAGDAAAVTHAHPLAREAAVLVSLATALALRGADATSIVSEVLDNAQSPEYKAKLEIVMEWIGRSASPTCREVASVLGNGVAAKDSCITAIFLAVSHLEQPFNELLAHAISLGGDVDTIAAMSCAIWGAGRGWGALPKEEIQLLERGDYIAQLASALESKSRSIHSCAEPDADKPRR